MTKRKTAKELHAEWMKDSAYAKAYADLEPEFQIASAVIKARATAGLTQADLATRMDTTQTAIARLESGNTMPSTRTLKRVAEATGLRMHFGFSGKGEATVASKALRTGKATRAQIRSMGGRIESELAAPAAAKRKKKR